LAMRCEHTSRIKMLDFVGTPPATRSSGWQERSASAARVLAQQRPELRAGNGACAEAGEVPLGKLTVDGDDRVRMAQPHQVRERGLGGVTGATEHRFSEEHPAEAHAIEPTHQRPRAPYLHAVAAAEAVQLEVGRT